MTDIAGIDLGTTNSLIGVMDAGFPILLADAAGERLTPSVVHFPETGEPLVGRAASRMRAIAPGSSVSSIKRQMGRRVGGKFGSPEQISALILAKLRRDAEAAMGRAITRAVITVPAYFNDAQRTATKAAGELAGFTVERIVSEPTAAALAYGLDKLGERSRIAVYDLGGGTFDISILELNQGVFQVIATNGDTQLGGDDIDAALLEHLAPPEINLARFREAIIDAKHRLSTEESVTIELPFAAAGHFSHTLTRDDLDRIARPIVEKTRAHCLRALADAQLAPADLDEVILVGGSTRMPIVRQLVRDIFRREPNTSQNPDEAVAIGATIQAGILAGTVRDMVLLDVTPLSLGIETFGGLMNVIIPRNSTIPTKAGEMFTNAVANQRAMLIRALQGEREMARDNWPLGEFEIAFPPAPKGRARVGVQFEIDANGILHVLARDTAGGGERVVEIRSAVDVSDEAVERMIAESLDHAFDDMSERVLTEARLKSEEMLPAVRAALGRVGGQLDEEEKARIASLMRSVESALATGSAQELKKANAALDDATQRLATLLIEQAVAASSKTVDAPGAHP